MTTLRTKVRMRLDNAKTSFELHAQVAMDKRFRARDWTMNDRLTERLRRDQQAQVDEESKYTFTT